MTEYVFSGAEVFVAFFSISASFLMDGQLQWSRWAETERQKRECLGATRCVGGVCVAYPSVPFLLGAAVLVPSGCWPSLRGGILSFILSRPRASSKFRIFLVGEKP